MIAYWWIPIVFGWYVLYNWVGHKNNGEDASNWWMLWIVMLGAMQWWAIVSRYSKNLVVDGFLYDALIVASFPLAMLLAGRFEGFTASQKAGAALVVIGLILLKKG